MEERTSNLEGKLRSDRSYNWSKNRFLANDGKKYTMLRMAYLTNVKTLQVGLMCASPQSDGFAVTFEEFKVNALG